MRVSGSPGTAGPTSPTDRLHQKCRGHTSLITGQVTSRQLDLEDGQPSSVGANTETQASEMEMVPGTGGQERSQKKIREPLIKQDNWAVSTFEKTVWNQVRLH